MRTALTSAPAAREVSTEPGGEPEPHRTWPKPDTVEVRAMPQRQWTKKEERQYKHIRDQAEDRGMGHDRAEEMAARTVNKERARKGETKTASRTSTKDMPSSKRGGQRSHSGPKGRTKEQLYQEARRKNIEGRSKMNKAELQRAVDRRS